MLADGRLVITGGEYLNNNFALTNLGAIYDPKANTWTNLPAPASWPYIGDSPSVVLPNGNYMVGNKLAKSMAVLNPKTLTWTVLPGTGKSDFNAEEGWTLLPDGSILTMDVKHAPNSERFVTSKKDLDDRRKYDRRPAFALALRLYSLRPRRHALLLPARRNWPCNFAT